MNNLVNSRGLIFLSMLSVMAILFVHRSASALPAGWSVDNSIGYAIVTTDLGVRWLSPAATVGNTVEEAGALYSDYELASVSDFRWLIAAYGLPETPNAYTIGTPVAGITAFFGDFGTTAVLPSSNSMGTGGILVGSMIGLVARSENGSFQCGGVLDCYTATVAPSPKTSYTRLGVWLIDKSVSVPEASSIILLGMGLLAVFSFRRRV